MNIPGKITLVTGPPGSGKSNLALLLGEMHLKKNPTHEILSNILLMSSFPRYRYFKLQSAFLWNITVMGGGTVILDEAGTFATSGAGDRRTIRGQLEALAKLIRKFDLDLIWIDQRMDNSIPPTIRDMSTWWFDLPYKLNTEGGGTVVLYRMVKGEGVKEDEWKNDRLTSIPYDHKSMATYKLDLPNDKTLFDVFDDLADTPSSKVKTEMQKWLRSYYVRPPTNAEFGGLYYRESTKGSGGPPDVEVCGLPDPSRPVDLRTVTWGILQRNPKIPTKNLAEILKCSPSIVQRYRQEFTGRSKIIE